MPTSSPNICARRCRSRRDRARRGDQRRELRRAAAAVLVAAQLQRQFFWTSNVSVRPRAARAVGAFDDVHRIRLGRIELGLRLRPRARARASIPRRSSSTTSRARARPTCPKMVRRARAQARTAERLRALHPTGASCGDRRQSRPAVAQSGRQPALPRSAWNASSAIKPRIALGALQLLAARRRERERTSTNSREPERMTDVRIVLSRTDRVGDLILSTPAIASMRRSFPDAHITIVCGPYNASSWRTTATSMRSTASRRHETRGFRAPLRGCRSRDRARAGPPTSGSSARRGRRAASATRTRIAFSPGCSHALLTDLALSEADPARDATAARRFVRHEVDQVLALAEWPARRTRARPRPADLRCRPRARRLLPAGAIACTSRRAGAATGAPRRA